MNFIALDLETTGLSPETDTIIEIAAIRFTIDMEGDIFVMKNSEERSMLIHPGRLLEQEVTMITGITSDMLVGKPSFDSVRDRVRDFIGDAIIVGHNVLFDIAMFASHGIDLESNRVIDTFELSEIFSQDIESLNLGFLANRYGLIDPDEAEHRALTDTKVSIRLFLKYLKEIRNLTGGKKQIWNILLSKDESHTLKTISKICHPVGDVEGDIHMIFCDLLGNKRVSPKTEDKSQEIIESSNNNRVIIDTHGNIEEEIALIKNTFKSHSHIHLIVPGYKVATWMSGSLQKNSIENMIAVPVNKWCSVEYIRELLINSESFSRKKMILILKLAFWMTETKTGLIDELKFYGSERNMIEIFRSNEQDSTIWREEYEQKIKNIPVLISDIYAIKIENRDNSRYTLIKDIPLLEDITRRIKSQEISFDRLYDAIQTLNCDGTLLEKKIHMADMISLIRGIYESIPDRPTGPLISPPGAYGETYFITQAILWHQGHKWLVHATRTLEQSWKAWKEHNKGSASREETLSIQYIEKSVGILFQYHTFVDSNTNVTLNITDEKTKITFIPRSIKAIIVPLINGSLGYGTNISLPQTEEFLIKECGYTNNEFSYKKPEKFSKKIIIPAEYHPGIIQPGTVILTTSQKHARDIGQALRKIHGKKIEVLIQGLSGGKGKMLSTFKNKIEQTILVGIIDTWRDEYDLWGCAIHTIIAKLPFDPPTDTYFLARTVGMSNNFSEYSEPIVTIRLNTLIERILSSGYIGEVIITDSRLTDTEWGKKIYNELL